MEQRADDGFPGNRGGKPGARPGGDAASGSMGGSSATLPGTWADNPRVLAIIDRLRDFTTAMEHYVDVRGGAHGMHRTDLHALGHIMNAAGRDEELTPGKLAAALSLSSPATSALLTRLEQAGHVRRVHRASDRRSVSVEMTDEARSVGRAVFAPLASSIADVITALDPAEQDTVLHFLQGVVDATGRATDNSQPVTDPPVPAVGQDGRA